MKLFIIKKKTLVIITVLLVVLLCSVACAVVPQISAMERKTPIYCVQTEEKKVAISFDACWGSDKTLDILAMLEHYDVVANYFCVQSWVEKYPDKLKALHVSGRVEIGTHSATHPHMASLTKKQIQAELTTSCEAIKKITGKAPILFRPPYGEYNNTLLDVCKTNNLYAIQWDVDTLDWKGLTASGIASRVLKNAKEGSIILMHNDGEHTVEALPLIILGLKKKGYEFVKISDLIYKSDYEIDNTGKQIPTK